MSAAQNSSETISSLQIRLTHEVPCLGCMMPITNSVQNPIQSPNSSVASDLGQPATRTDQQGCWRLHSMTEEMHKAGGEQLKHKK